MNIVVQSEVVIFKLLVFVITQTENAALQSVGIKNSLYEIPGLGNQPVMIKAIPGIENYQSDIFEVYAEPYLQNLYTKAAIAILQAEAENGITGEIMFIQRDPPLGPTLITGNITGLPAGKHGFHIHQSGDLRQGCEKIGGHFNPYLLRHGAPFDPIRHVGDLGNIEAGEDGKVEIRFVDPLISLTGGPRGVVGRSLVVATNEDNLGVDGTADSLLNGQSGKPLACGVIAYIR
ncbi:unnamed protein product [Psylliodes chrysocephalus]|uniref:superoxide dismutase n=1 Tax=Psylliodes chrysocephalus TaxID=3402493 RepID=A0A9P0GC28_9CUCU|nr:unnamed protein product [Psylliodes chrysocephala]